MYVVCVCVCVVRGDDDGDGDDIAGDGGVCGAVLFAIVGLHV